MCPEPGLISAFVDGEVPSPWKERIAGHLSACSDCAQRARGYGALRAALLAPSACQEAESAVLRRLEARLGPRLAPPCASPEAAETAGIAIGQRSPGLDGSTRAAGSVALWRRRLAIPMPIAAVAAAAIVFFAGLAFAGIIKPARPAVQNLAAAELSPLSSPPANMEALIRYLETQDAKVNLTIQLPSGATLDSSGKPLVVRAADANFLPMTGTVGK